MTIIRDMFVKPIDRQMNPVIKVADQDDEDIIFQELDEYVVTNEINQNLGKLYKGIAEGVKSRSDSVGVWITGDFGSGKSHFLKIVSFLLQNKSICGKPSIDYLRDKVGVDIYQLLQSMGRKKVDTILFDIDAEAKEGKDTDNLVQTYLLVFNRMLGLSTNASVAEMERHLIENGKYDDFKSKFSELHGKDWVEVRNKPTFYKDKIATALFQSGSFSEEMAKSVAQEATERHEVSAEDFSELVKKHCEKQGPDYMLVFLVDEVGQFISGNRQRILKLQTITEHLGIKCRGQAWNIVTSQEDVEAIVSEFKDMDFSKIQGRFSTRIKMSSTDVKEVIEKRILEKKEGPSLELKAYYESNSTAIQNKLSFDNTMSIALYRNSKEFADTYPFVPYQYGMLQNMLTELRDKSRAGKNISNAARSMLKTFKDTVVLYEEKGPSTVIPMYSFFESLTTELDTPTLIVFKNAERNEALEMPLDLDVLKTLFLVKYYEGLKTNITNITAMMVSDFGQNRIELQKDIESSLDRLVSQNLVQRSGDCYVFLTNEEQEVTQAIKRESVERDKRLQAISHVAFGEIFGISTKYRYDSNHLFPYTNFVDGENIDNTNHDLKIFINTPANRMDPASLALQSYDGGVVIDLPPDRHVVDQFTEYLATESFVRKCDTSELSSSKKLIVAAKQSEIKEMKVRARDLLSVALQHAKFYINGQPVDIPESSPEKRLSSAMKNLIESVYSKMDYMRSSKSLKDIESVFRNSTLEPFDQATGSLRLAFDEVIGYLQNAASRNETVRVRNLVDKFTKKPYGFNDYDIEWILAMLFRHGKVELVSDGVSYEGRSVGYNVGMDLVTKTKNFDRVVIHLHETVSQDSLFKAGSIYQEIFTKVCQNDENALVEAYNKSAKEKIEEVDEYLAIIDRNPRYPYCTELKELRGILNNLASKGSPHLFEYVESHEQDLREFNSRFDDISNFYAPGSARKKLFDKGLSSIDAYNADKTHIQGEFVIETVSSIERIITSDLRSLPKLNELCRQFDSIIEEQRKDIIEEKKSRLETFYNTYQQRLIGHPDLQDRLNKTYNSIVDTIDASVSITDIVLAADGFDSKADAIIRSIPAPSTPPGSGHGVGTQAQSSKSEPSRPSRGSFYVKLGSSRVHIDSEADIEAYLDELRTSMKKKLSEGSFDIKW